MKTLKKTVFTTVITLIMSVFGLQAQSWTPGTNGFSLTPTTANLGIGITAAASAKLRLENNQAASSEMYGLYSSTSNSHTTSTSATYGIRTNISSQNMGHIYGHRIEINNDNTSSTANTYGSRTALTSYHPGLTYGNFIVIDNYNTSSTANTYGIYADVKSSSNDNTVFGVYSKVTGGNKRWAGYFSGGDMFFSENVGIGTTNPVMKLHVAGNTYVSGNVGIGIVNPTTKLDVAGVVRAHEVRVCLNQGCDYVFADDYKLMNLNDLSNFVKTNRHLPEVAPAVQMEAEGINLSEMNALLLKKIEELTLYVMELNKKIEILEGK